MREKIIKYINDMTYGWYTDDIVHSCALDVMHAMYPYESISECVNRLSNGNIFSYIERNFE